MSLDDRCTAPTGLPDEDAAVGLGGGTATLVRERPRSREASATRRSHTRSPSAPPPGARPNAVGLGADSAAEIAQIASRVRGFARSLLEAHDLGFGPGDQNELWTLEFHRIAAPAYSASLPPWYAFELALTFERYGALMAASPAPSEAAHAWTIISSYLNGASCALLETTPPDGRRNSVQRRPIGATTPAVMRYDLLACVASREGATRLDESAAELLRALEQVVEHGISDEERTWLSRLMRGDRLLDIAVDAQLSERSLHRRLDALQGRLGVRSRIEAVAYCVQRGWMAGPLG